MFTTIDTAHRKVNLDDTESWSWNSTHAVSWKERWMGRICVCLFVCSGRWCNLPNTQTQRLESDSHKRAALGGQTQPLRPAVRSRIVDLRGDKF